MKTQNDAVVLTLRGFYGLVCDRRCSGGGMAYLYRLGFSLFLALSFLVALLFPGFARAYPAIVSPGSVWSIVGGANTPLGTNLSAGWTAYISRLYGGPNGAYCDPVVVGANSQTSACHSTYNHQSVIAPVVYSCPDLSPVVNGQCVCSLPATEVNGACVTPPNPNQVKCAALAGKPGGPVQAPDGGPLKRSTYTSLCGQDSEDSHCSMTVFYSMRVGGQKYGEATYTGGTCVPDPSSDGSVSSATPPLIQPPAAGESVPAGASAPTCPPGTAAGEINGVRTCKPVDFTKKEVETVDKKTGVSPDGTKTESTDETTCKGGQCTTTTTTTTTPPGGGVSTTTTTTKDQPKDGFCIENPRSPVCVTSSFSGGACNSPPVCSGDAVQCATASFTWKTACAFESSAAVATEENAYASARAVTGDQTTGSSINSTVNVSASSFDQTNLLGAEVGLSDLTVTVMGRATTLPLSGLNTWFDVLGKLLMGVTAILCMRIVARG